jgi:hypothetical protein
MSDNVLKEILKLNPNNLRLDAKGAHLLIIIKDLATELVVSNNKIENLEFKYKNLVSQIRNLELGQDNIQ